MVIDILPVQRILADLNATRTATCNGTYTTTMT